ncbi:cupin domain-containing protein [Streptomyces gamaensis]|uniref:Cupin domain-containing protein n=1 Tax=Streptomyces gamaensis TaxID=1763542 RepID=A0ABW0YYP6_9ACTN
MIIQRAAAPVRLLTAKAPDAEWTCLARRGMLHSECEAVDLLRLAPGAVVRHGPAEGVEQALYVLAGRGEAEEGGTVRELAPGALLLAPHDGRVAVRALGEGLELLTVRVLPAGAVGRLPARVPELPEEQRTKTVRQAVTRTTGGES